MNYTRLGTTGLTVSRLCLGAMTYGSPDWHPWTLDEAASRPFIKRALEHGITFFDTADMYSRGVGEEVLGRALKDFASRDQVVVATKVFHPMGPGANDRGLSRKHILDAIDASLRRLGMDYVDLYQIHRFDYDTPIEETLAGARRCRAGRQGALHRRVEHVRLAVREDAGDVCGATAGPASSRCRTTTTSSIARKSVRCCRSAAPKASASFRTARWRAVSWPATDRKPAAVPRSAPTATSSPRSSISPTPTSRSPIASARSPARRGVSRMQVALAWMLSRPGVTAPIVGASKLAHLDEAVGALDVTLTPEECASLEELYQPHPVVGPL